MVNNNYNPEQYWNDRYFFYGKEWRSSGDQTLTEEKNIAEYEKQAAVMDKIITPLIKDNCKILEIGCGFGFWAKYLTKFPGIHYAGHDISEEAVKQCLEVLQKENFIFAQNDITANMIKDKFDIILMVNVSQHIPNIEAAIKNIKPAMKPGSVLIATEWKDKHEQVVNYEWYRGLGVWEENFTVSNIFHFGKHLLGMQKVIFEARIK